MKKLLLISLFIFLPASTVSAADVCLEWDASTDTVDGYYLYYDTDMSGPPYANKTDVGNVLTFTVPAIVGNAWFAVTAHAGGLESGYSNEVTGAFPPAPPGGLKQCTKIP